jgi:molecular chaperone GrpE
MTDDMVTGGVPDSDAGPAAPEGDGAPGAEDALTRAEAESAENREKYLRLAAEMENLRKRSVRDLENARKFGIEKFAEDLLGVVDSLEMGLEAGANASVESLLEGKTATLKLFRTALDKAGVTVIDPEGEPFDPEVHEAMMVQSSDTAEPGSVLAVIQKGYELNGRLLRPARVVVASEPEQGSGA